MKKDHFFMISVVIYIVILVILSVHITNQIKANFIVAESLVDESKKIMLQLDEMKPSELQIPAHFYAYIYSSDGTKVYLDSKESTVDDEGMKPEKDEKILFQKMLHHDNLYTHHIIDFNVYIIAAHKQSNASYTVIAFAVI